jgi:hypothetical protein
MRRPPDTRRPIFNGILRAGPFGCFPQDSLDACDLDIGASFAPLKNSRLTPGDLTDPRRRHYCLRDGALTSQREPVKRKRQNITPWRHPAEVL